MRKRICIMSLISLLVSVLGIVIYVGCFYNRSFVPVFVPFAIISVILPILAKKQRISNDQKGGWMEIVAIVIGGYNFYFVIFALTSAPMFVGFIGWIICGIVYKLVKPKIKEQDNHPV